MNYRVIDKETYYRKGVYRHFTEDCKCSTSMTARIDVTELVKHSKESDTKFYVNFLYILSKVLNSRNDYRMGYLWLPVTVRMNHAIADGYLVANVFRLLEKEIYTFCDNRGSDRNQACVPGGTQEPSRMWV